MRSIASAFKTLRLYPPASPIPQQAAEACSELLAAFLGSHEAAVIRVERDGLSWEGEPLGASTSNINDLGDRLRDLGVAEVMFIAPCRSRDVLTFVRALSAEPDDTLAGGGLGLLLSGSGVSSIQVAEISIMLESKEQSRPNIDLPMGRSVGATATEDADVLLRSIAASPERLTAWLSGAYTDRSGLDGGLEALASAAGSPEAPAAALASSFSGVPPEQRDALLALAMEPGCSTNVTGAFVAMLPDDAVADALTGGRFGTNMLALSNALSRLPLGDRLSRVMEHVHANLAAQGHGDKERKFLDHMVTVREADEQVPIGETEPDLDTIARSVRDDVGDLSRQRTELADARDTAAERALYTMLTLLDQQRDYGLYVETIDRIAGMIPGLVAAGDVRLANRALSELAGRSIQARDTWPGLSDRFESAVSRATGPETTGALLRFAVAGGPATVPAARELIQWGGEPAVRSLTGVALSSGDGRTFDMAETIVGRRMLDELCRIAPSVQAGGVAAVSRRLAQAAAEPRCAAALEALASRPDPESRREVAAVVGRVDTTGAITLAERLLADKNADVALVAASALGHNPSDAASRPLAQRMSQLDVDGRDFPLAREIVLALARHRDPIAEAALDRLASRRSFIKRANFTAMQEIVRQATAMQRGTAS